MRRITGIIGLLWMTSIAAQAQYKTQAQKLVGTSEDSLNRGAATSKTVISGYGSFFYQRDFYQHTSTAGLDRAVLFVGHQFNAKIAFFSELEVENALVASNGSDEFHNDGKGDVAMEQAYLKFNLNPKQYIIAGLFTPRIGITNENHLPVNFNGVERPQVEQLIIPTTWREIGVGFYGTARHFPLNYDIAVVNGLNSANFTHGTGIAGGEGQGSNASANNLGVTAALQYTIPHFTFQVSGYAGGTVGLSPRKADSIGLSSGAFGTPVYLGEGDIQFYSGGVTAKILGTYIDYPDAARLNEAYTTNIGTGMYGAYAELGYDWLYKQHRQPQFITFVRGEMLDLNASIPTNGVYDGTLKQTHIIAGISYLPIPNIVIKADVRLLHTGPQNPALLVNPAPNALPYKQSDQFLNLGVGYSF